MSQGDEFFFLHENDKVSKIRLHDYKELFTRAGLYEFVYHSLLECQTPDVLIQSIKQSLCNARVEIHDLRVLEIGAGNGVFGEKLRLLGPAGIDAIDVLKDARNAACRDRPHVYDNYTIKVIDEADEGSPNSKGNYFYNLIVLCASVGFSDVSFNSLRSAFDSAPPGTWFAFTLEANSFDDVMFSPQNPANRLCNGRELEVYTSRRYVHRKAVTGHEIDYVVVVGRKRSEPTSARPLSIDADSNNSTAAFDSSDSRDSHRGKSSIEEKQFEMLARSWALQETLKGYRSKFPAASASLMITIAGFVLGNERLGSSLPALIAAASINAVLMLCSLWAISVVRERYNVVDDRIIHLYKKLEMIGPAFFSDDAKYLAKADGLFVVAYLVILLIGLTTIIALSVSWLYLIT